MGLISANATIKESLAPTTAEISADEAFARGNKSFLINTPEYQSDAEKWLRIAAVKGHLKAQHYLASVLSHGLFGEPESVVLFFADFACSFFQPQA